MKIAVVGGGSTYTPELVNGLLTIGSSLGFSEISLIDVPKGEGKLNIVGSLARRMVAHAGSRLSVTTTMDVEAGLDGATVIVNQFRVGGFEARALDERIPLKYGLIGQETTGVGGMMKALRTLPVLETVVDVARRRAPAAWMINFTNPAGLNTEYLRTNMGYDRSIGLCNVPIEFLLKAAATLECEREEVFLKYYGLNHLSWVESVMRNGVDQTDAFWDTFRLQMKNNPDETYHPSFLSLLRLLPNPYLQYYYNTRAMLAREVEDRDGDGTRAEQIQRLEPTLLALYGDPDRTTIPEELAQRGGFMYSTVAVELIRDILTNSRAVHIINAPNRGAVANLPDDYVLEIPARITADGPHVMPIGEAHIATVGLIHTIKSFERLVIRAHQERDSRWAKQAMLIHPLGPDERDLEALWQELAAANRPFISFSDGHI